jgi:tetratricopeptide (TPR) repeat protein
MRRRVRNLVALLVCLALLLGGVGRVFAQSPMDALLAKAAALTATGQHVEAYAVLSAEEDTYIGDIKFDYVLGRAALHAGRPDRATIAFSRVLALEPGHAGARIDSGRAYLALGNRAQAEVAFRELLALDPPPAIRTRLLIYLAEARGERKARVATRAYLDVFAGTSSNVNQSPSQVEVRVPVFQATLRLADQNVAKADSFTGIGGGAELAMPLSEHYSFTAGAEFLTRAHRHESDFDVGGAAASLGLARTGERIVARVKWQSAVNTLGGHTSRKVEALGFDISETTVPREELGAWFGFLNFGTYRHPAPELQLFDADFSTIGGGVSAPIDEKSTLAVMLLAGEDKDKGGNPGGDRFGWGMRLFYDRVLSPKVRFTALVASLNSDYTAEDPSFLTKRADRKMDLELTLRYKLSANLEARLGALRSVQDSNIPIYEFRRTDWTLGLRYQFD